MGKSYKEKMKWLYISQALANIGSGLGSGGPMGEWGNKIGQATGNIAQAEAEKKAQREAEKKRKGGIFGKIGGLLGGIAGTAIGGPIGGAIGGALGSAGGGAAGGSMDMGTMLGSSLSGLSGGLSYKNALMQGPPVGQSPALQQTVSTTGQQSSFVPSQGFGGAGLGSIAQHQLNAFGRVGEIVPDFTYNEVVYVRDENGNLVPRYR